jgi:predicted TIM-barrel fold metal-dependent hydrolase
MPVIDAQVHAYERDHPGRPWAANLHGPAEVTGDDMVAAMDAVGVDGALLVSPWTMYRFDASYACEVHDAHPDRFGLIKPIDPTSDDITETVAEWAGTPGAVGIRIMLVGRATEDPTSPGVNAILEAGGRHGLPVNILCWGRLPVVGELAGRHPDTQLVVDHLGLQQPFEPPAPPEPWADLDQVVALADHDNVAVKITGACTLAHEPFPYPDIWAPLGRLFDAFGLERCLWGTDWTRAVELLTYEQGVEAFRVHTELSDDDRAMLMGGALERVYRWSPGGS